MADERVRQPVKITDPTTDANEAGVDASGNLQVILAANSGVDIGDVDVLSVTPGTAAGNLGKAEDVASAGGDTLVGMAAVQDAALAALTSVDGDYTWLRVNANGALWTQDVGVDAALAGNELQVDIVAALPTGANTIGSVNIAANDGVDIGNVDVASVVPGTGATNLGKAENAASAGADTLVGMAAVQDAALSALGSIDGDYTWLRVNANGALWVDQDGTVTVTDDGSFTLAANSGVDIGDVDVISVVPGTGATNLGKAENAASAGGDVGVAVMAVQDAALSALGSIDGDYTHLRVDANGALHVTGGGGGTEYTEDVAAPADPVGTALQLVRADTPATIASADGDWVAQRSTNYGAAYVQVVDSTGSFVNSFGGEATPTNPVRTENSSTNTAAGSSFDVDTADLGGTTKKVSGFVASASVPVKAELIQVDNDVDTVHVTAFARAGEVVIYKPPHRNFHNVTFTANAGFDGWTLRITNLDNSQAADLYGTLFTED